MKSAQQKKIIDLNYVDHFDYKVKVITKIDVLKGYTDITHISKFKVWNLLLWKRINISIVVFYTNFKMKKLKLMFKIVFYQKKRRKGVKKFLLQIQKIESRVVWIRERFLSNLGRLI
jgi:hypothetical protein